MANTQGKLGNFDTLSQTETKLKYLIGIYPKS